MWEGLEACPRPPSTRVAGQDLQTRAAEPPKAQSRPVSPGGGPVSPSQGSPRAPPGGQASLPPPGCRSWPHPAPRLSPTQGHPSSLALLAPGSLPGNPTLKNSHPCLLPDQGLFLGDRLLSAEFCHLCLQPSPHQQEARSSGRTPTGTPLLFVPETTSRVTWSQATHVHTQPQFLYLQLCFKTRETNVYAAQGLITTDVF